MNFSELKNFLEEVRPRIIEAVTDDACSHFATLLENGTEFYGYAVLPGDPFDIHELVAVTNALSEIKVSAESSQYRYYRYSVDEWSHWHRGQFAASSLILADASRKFAAAHTGQNGNYSRDEIELAYCEGLLEAITTGIEMAKESSTFPQGKVFFAVWVSDTGSDTVSTSVRRLNSPGVTAEYLKEFG